jgi:hypothetical protein
MTDATLPDLGDLEREVIQLVRANGRAAWCASNFFVLAPDRDASAKAGEPVMQRIRTATVAMPLAGFAGSLKMLDDLRQKLVTDGILRPSGDTPTPEPQRKSPNFG